MYWKDLSEDSAFNDYMDDLDNRLRDAGVEIVARPLRACSYISQELKVRFTMDSPVFRRINDWFEKRYGDRLKMDWSIGQMVVSVRGDPYAVRYPLVYGTVQLNLLRLIDKGTPKLFEALSPGELQELGDVLKAGFEAFLKMSVLPPLLLSDLPNAVQQLMKRPPDPGLSKWSSQQAVEKVLTAFIKARRPTFRRPKGGKHIHDLEPLVREAEELGLKQVDRTITDAVDCEAGARYAGRLPVSVMEAIRANQKAVALCGQLAAQWDAPTRSTEVGVGGEPGSTSSEAE